MYILVFFFSTIRYCPEIQRIIPFGLAAISQGICLTELYIIFCKAFQFSPFLHDVQERGHNKEKSTYIFWNIENIEIKRRAT